MATALMQIRAFCRDGTLLDAVKIMDIYHVASMALEPRDKFIADMRSGRK